MGSTSWNHISYPPILSHDLLSGSYRSIGPYPQQADIDLALDELPLFRGPKRSHQVVERLCVGFRVVEQGQEVERFLFRQVTAVMEAAGYRRQVLQADPDVA